MTQGAMLPAARVRKANDSGRTSKIFPSVGARWACSASVQKSDCRINMINQEVIEAGLL